jgi:endonuclease/exonuclease/phosphatase family metal-dependent hydrolase
LKIGLIFQKVFFYINIGLAILLLLSYVSVFINPDFFWPMALFGLAYPFILVLNIFAVFFWLLLRRIEFLVSFLVILLGWNFLIRVVHIPFHFRKISESTLSATSRVNQLKIISFNVRDFNQYNWTNNLNTEQEIIDFLRTQKADIICLQEYFTRESGKISRRDLLRELSGTPYTHVYYLSGRNKLYKHGIAIFSALPIINKGVLLFENSRNVGIFADILLNKDTIRIYNNHLQSINFIKRNYDFIDTAKFVYNEKQVDELKDISEKLRDGFIKRSGQVEILTSHMKLCHFPKILCGDFNDTPVSYTYQQISKYMKDAFIESGRGFGQTYRGVFPSFRIDYVLFSKEFECTGFTTLNKKLSDHFPLIAKLKLKRAVS